MRSITYGSLLFAACAVLFDGKVIGQTSMPIGIVRGDIVSRTGTNTAGEFTVRNTSNLLYSCSYDAHTYFERDHHPIAVAGLIMGDPVEVVADHNNESRAGFNAGLNECYARTVQVAEVHAEKLIPGRKPRLRAPESATELFAPRGDMTFGGTVLRCDASVLMLRTRDGDKTIFLRPDTRYWSQGLRADPAALLVNTHVFIRAGHNVEGNIEAYQVIWGGIVTPP